MPEQPLRGDVVMPFGKHKGECLADIPVGYLDWLIGQDFLRGDLRDCIERHLEDRPEWKRERHDA